MGPEKMTIIATKHSWWAFSESMSSSQLLTITVISILLVDINTCKGLQQNHTICIVVLSCKKKVFCMGHVSFGTFGNIIESLFNYRTIIKIKLLQCSNAYLYGFYI